MSLIDNDGEIGSLFRTFRIRTQKALNTILQTEKTKTIPAGAQKKIEPISMGIQISKSKPNGGKMIQDQSR
jgi:hypothetical protein